MLKPWRFAVPVALSLAVLAGCTSTSEEKPAVSGGVSPQPTADKRREIETKKADCMKQKGFKYIAYVPKPEPDAVVKARLGDYAAMKEHRAKYGFDIFSVSVYGIADTPGVENLTDNPNAALAGELSEAQSAAFSKAGGECQVQAVNAVLGKNFRSDEEIYQEADRVREREEHALDADPGLVRLAPGYADCLKAKGHRIGNTKPTKVVTALRDLFRGELLALMQEKTGGSGQLRMDLLTAEEAKPYLAREIKAALEDLECGKEFHAIYGPKNARITAASEELVGDL
ncbi:hypothetical protein [Rhizohabitans arisaemae]|uniref:hypothetical protein n=1 Tax=Rhizohabitans arisaemae TaxID=2720610 RepID=UPI0024B1FC85|nr:hypothetical protein [Rhizohabitans arisaemae]